MYCIYSDLIKMYWNFNTKSFTSLNSNSFNTLENAKNEVNKIDTMYEPKVHTITTKEVYESEEVSAY